MKVLALLLIAFAVCRVQSTTYFIRSQWDPYCDCAASSQKQFPTFYTQDECVAGVCPGGLANPKPTYFYARNLWWSATPGGAYCGCGQVTWDSGFTTQADCEAACPAGSTTSVSAEFFYRSQWGNYCTCDSVSWQSEFSSQSDCVAGMCGGVDHPSPAFWFAQTSFGSGSSCGCSVVTYQTQFETQQACESAVCSSSSSDYYARSLWGDQCDCGVVNWQSPYSGVSAYTICVAVECTASP